MIHFLDGALENHFMKPFITTVATHLGMDNVLVDRSEFLCQPQIQVIDNQLVAFDVSHLVSA
jgi:hypothetical protein